MIQFERNTKCYESKIINNTVVVRLGADALKIVTESDKKQDFLGLLESISDSPDALGYVQIDDSEFYGVDGLRELIKLMLEKDTPQISGGGYMGMLDDIIAARFRHSVGALMMSMSKFKKPAVAGFQGKIRGEYLGFTLSFDSRIATKDTTFSFDNVRLGIPASPGLTFLMPRYIGEGRTLSLLNRGAEIDAEEAYSLGLITKVVEHLDDLEKQCVRDVGALIEYNEHIVNSHRKLIRPTPDDISSALERYYKVAAEAIIAIRSDPKFQSK